MRPRHSPAGHSGYCRLLYQRYSNFEEVARRTGLDSRIVKRHIRNWDAADKEDE